LTGGGSVPVRKGDMVSIGAWATHHNPKFWDSPEKFDPYRFDANAANPPANGQWVPFGGGKRVCIGQHFSLIEQRLFLATMLQKFEFVPVSTREEVAASFGGGLLLAPIGVKVGFKPLVA
jgi:cytochrome P450